MLAGSQRFEGECFVAKRFPVPQKDKVRMVDDFSVCGVNGAYGLREKLRVQAVDELCSYLAYMLDVAKERDSPKLTGRTCDLKSAYQKFGVDPWHADRLKIAVKKPGGGVGFFLPSHFHGVGDQFFENFRKLDIHRNGRIANPLGQFL